MRKTKNKRVNWRKAALDLASCATFTLAHYKHLGRGSGQVIDLKTREMKGPWQDKFFDALDAIGAVYDREAYYAERSKRGRR